MMAYKMNRFWILLKPCHVFPDWMIVEGIVQLRVRVVQEDKEEVETCILCGSNLLQLSGNMFRGI